MNPRVISLIMALACALPCAASASFITPDSDLQIRLTATGIALAESHFSLSRPVSATDSTSIARPHGRVFNPEAPEGLLHAGDSHNGSLSMPNSAAFGSSGGVAIVSSVSVLIPPLNSTALNDEYRLFVPSPSPLVLSRPPKYAGS